MSDTSKTIADTTLNDQENHPFPDAKDVLEMWKKGIQLARYFPTLLAHISEGRKIAGNELSALEKYTQCEDLLTDQIAEGEVFASGVRRKPDRSEGPEIIDAGMLVGASIFFDESRLQSPDLEFRQIRILAPSKRFSSPPVEASEIISKGTLKGGRPNQRQRVKEEVRRLLPELRSFGARQDQAREIRARLEGEGTRFEDEFPEMSTQSIKRWIGEVVRKTKRTE